MAIIEHPDFALADVPQVGQLGDKSGSVLAAAATSASNASFSSGRREVQTCLGWRAMHACQPGGAATPNRTKARIKWPFS